MEPLENTVTILNAAVADVGKLVNLHLELLREEAKKSALFAKRIAVLGFLLILGLIPTCLMLALAFSHLLQMATGWHEWQCELLIAGLCLSGCLVLAYNARAQLRLLQEK